MSIVINENGSNVTIKDVIYKPFNSDYKFTNGIVNNNGIVSGFSATECVSLDKVMPYTVKGPWEVQIKFKETEVADRLIGHCLAYDGATSDIPQGMVFGLVDGKPTLWISSTNTSWDVAQEEKAVNSINMNTWYWAKIGWDATEYYVLLSEDGKIFTKVISVVSLLPINPTQDWQLGSYTTGTNFCHGEIDLNETYFSANGEIWFDKYKYVIKEIYDDSGEKLYASSNPYTLTLNTNVDNCSVVFHVNGEDLSPTTSTSNSYSLTTEWTGEIGYTVSKTDYITVEDSVDSLEEDKSVNVTLEEDTRIQQIYDASGNLVNIDDLDIITEKQFNSAYKYNKVLSGELKSFPTTEIKNYGLDYAFDDCTGITGSVSFPNLTSVDESGLRGAFYNCTGLTGSVSFPALTSVGYRGLYEAFRGCTDLTGSVSFPNLTSIGDHGLYHAFYECTNLTGSVSFPTLTSVDDSGLYEAFRGCAGLTGSILFPNLTYIRSYGLQKAFYNCTGLTGSVSFPALTSVGSSGLRNTFDGCTGITEVHFKTSMSGNSECTGYQMGCPNATVYFDLP